MTEGTIFVPVCHNIGEYIYLQRGKIFVVKPSIYVKENYFLPKLLISVKEK